MQKRKIGLCSGEENCTHIWLRLLAKNKVSLSTARQTQFIDFPLIRASAHSRRFFSRFLSACLGSPPKSTFVCSCLVFVRLLTETVRLNLCIRSLNNVSANLGFGGLRNGIFYNEMQIVPSLVLFLELIRHDKSAVFTAPWSRLSNSAQTFFGTCTHQAESLHHVMRTQKKTPHRTIIGRFGHQQ